MPETHGKRADGTPITVSEAIRRAIGQYLRAS
jgi:hypothetical protein